MRPFRFVQCGDLHLGAPFKYLKSLGKQVDQAVANATYRSFDAIVDYAIQEHVQAFLITGDVYNSEDHNLEAQVRFIRALHRLDDKDIPVYMVQGNHDPAESWQAHIEMPKNVYIFSAAHVERFPLMVNGLEIGGIYGISCGHGNIDKSFVKDFQPHSQDEFSIALMHGTVGVSGEHALVGPCQLGDLLEASVDYWALGHIHKRDILHTDPYIVYAGNSQGLHKKEVGPKGCYLVQVSSNGHCDFTFKETCAIRFEQVAIDISNLHNEAELVEMIRHEKEMLRTNRKKPVLLEIILQGSGDLHTLCAQEEIRHLWLTEAQDEEDGQSQFVMPYSLQNYTQPKMDLKARRHLSDMVGDYLLAFDKLSQAGQESLQEDYIYPQSAIEQARSIVEQRSEAKRLGVYSSFITDELLNRALGRAQVEGALLLAGETDED